ncbi:MAG: rhodanese-like domain-containing protein [Hyphomicrobiaceae bacterium]
MTASQPSKVDDVTVGEVWQQLKANPASVLIDVRTRSEWAFVGLPDLSALNRRPVLVEWLTFPDNRLNAGFATELAEQLKGLGVDHDTELFFICRSGGRSRQAAQVMAAAGYRHCHNVAEGFEGPLDAEKRRGRHSGWKAEGLPWNQG